MGCSETTNRKGGSSESNVIENFGCLFHDWNFVWVVYVDNTRL